MCCSEGDKLDTNRKLLRKYAYTFVSIDNNSNPKKGNTQTIKVTFKQYANFLNTHLLQGKEGFEP